MTLTNAMLETLLLDENDVVRDLARHIVEYRRILEKAQGHREDARRYRWLRDTNERAFRAFIPDKVDAIGCIDAIFIQDQIESSIAISSSEMDAAIDAAKRRWPA